MGRRSDEMKDYYTAGELAALMRVADKVIYEMARAGKLAHHMAGQVMRFRRADVEPLLTARVDTTESEAAPEQAPGPIPAPGRKKMALGVLGCAVLAAIAWQRARRKQDDGDP